MEPISAVLGFGSVALSIYAVVKAKSADNAVAVALSAKNAQEDLSQLEELLRILSSAKDAARLWVDGVPAEKRQGLVQDHALFSLGDAIDALQTKSPFHGSSDEGALVVKSANRLQRAYDEIVDPKVNENKWQSAVSELQSLIGRLENIKRKIRDKNIVK